MNSDRFKYLDYFCYYDFDTNTYSGIVIENFLRFSFYFYVFREFWAFEPFFIKNS